MKTLDRESEREHLAKLGEFLNCETTRDECGDYIVRGRNGAIHADGVGYNAFLTFKSRKGRRIGIEALKPFGVVKQCGDTEICFFFVLDRVSPVFTTVLKKIQRFRPRKNLSDERRAELSARMKGLHNAKRT